jgi:hypothetical protein
MYAVHTSRRPADRSEGHPKSGPDVPPRGAPAAYAVGMRLVSADEAASVVRSGDRIYVHCAAATPSVLLDSLVARAAELTDVTVVHLHTRARDRTSRRRWRTISGTGRCSSDRTRAPP